MGKNVITAYKGFEHDLTCRGFQYEVGKEYSIDGEIEYGERGFHACENPLDVIDYYGDMSRDRYCVVELYGDVIKNDKNNIHSIIASSKIRIKEEITLEELFKRGCEWLNNTNNSDKGILDGKLLEDNGVNHGKIASTNNWSKFFSCGDNAQIGASGNNAKIASNGIFAKIASNGSDADILSSGLHSDIVSSGLYSHIASNGISTKILSSASFSKIAVNGIDTQINSNGEYAQIVSSGADIQITSKGDNSIITSSGEETKIDSKGKNAIVMCAGEDSIAKAKKGSWITLTEWGSSETEEKIPICVKAEYVDGERIKEDIYYKLKDGEFVEVLL